jgi:hypothetical protein
MAENMPATRLQNLLAPEMTCNWFYDPAVRELCKKARDKGNLTADEILLLALAAGQAAYARYIHPDSAHDAERTLEEIGAVLDHDAVGAATHAKAVELLKKRQDAPLLQDSHVQQEL